MVHSQEWEWTVGIDRDALNRPQAVRFTDKGVPMIDLMVLDVGLVDVVMIRVLWLRPAGAAIEAALLDLELGFLVGRVS